MNFKNFDRRNYPTVSAIRGYSEWAATYDNSVPNQLDIRVLEQLKSIKWEDSKQCLDLACGTGRIGSWLREKGVPAIDGIDLTPEMLKRAEARRIYRTLLLGSIESTGICTHYDVLVMSLVDEHLPSLKPFYREAARLGQKNAKLVVVGMHPFFFMMGMPTHFSGENGSPTAIETHIHLMSEHVEAAFSAGWRLLEMHEGVVDDEWLKTKPKWEALREYPVNYGYVWCLS